MKKRIISCLLSAMMITSAVPFAAQAFDDDITEDTFKDAVLIEDYDWLDNNVYFKIKEVYLRYNTDTDSAAISYVQEFPDEICFKVSANADIDDISHTAAEIDPELVLNFNNILTDGGYYITFRSRTESGEYKRIKLETAKLLYKSVKENVMDYYNCKLGQNFSDTVYYSYLTEYYGKGDIEEKLEEYIAETGLNAKLELIGKSDIYETPGASTPYYRYRLVPETELSGEDHLALAKDIYEKTELIPNGHVFENLIDDTTAGIVIDAVNSVEGDANCDGEAKIGDAVAVLQSIALPDKYALTEQGKFNADIDCNGITASDAIAIQKMDAGIQQ